MASFALAAGDLEWHNDPLARLKFDYLLAKLHDLRYELMPHSDGWRVPR